MTDAVITNKIFQDGRYQNIVNVNKVRLICALFYLIGVFANLDTYQNQQHLFFSFGMGLIYCGFISIMMLWYKQNKTPGLYPQYIALFVDYLIFLGVVVVRGIFEAPTATDVFAYILKNPLYNVLYVLLLLPLIFLRRSLIVFSGIVFSIIFLILLCGLVVYSPGYLTQSWKEHIFGDKIVLKLLLLYAFLGISFSAISYFTVRLLNVLVRTISTSEIQKNKLKKYFSPDIVNQLIDKEKDDIFGKGTRLQLAILFIDIEGFTKISEKLSPEELALFLGDFRSLAVEQIFKHSGAVDKFIGDAIMAIFGIPISREQSSPKQAAYHAVKATFAIYNKLQQEKKVNQRLAPCKIRMGVHIGEVFIGNIQSYSQIEYTVIGRTVNIASRLEALCKDYNAACIISEAIHQHVEEKISKKKKYENINIRGIHEPMNIYVLF